MRYMYVQQHLRKMNTSDDSQYAIVLGLLVKEDVIGNRGEYTCSVLSVRSFTFCITFHLLVDNAHVFIFVGFMG